MSETSPEHFDSLVDELRHLVDDHDVEETKQLWNSDRAKLDVIHIEAHGLRDISTIEGVTAWMRSDGDTKCICCDGPHVFSYGVDLIDAPMSSFRSEKEDIRDWIQSAIRKAPEGARLRFTVEVLDE
jgi:hypothetical protein